MQHLRADYTEIWTTSRNVPLIQFADRVRSIAETGLDLTGITQGAPASLSEFDEIVSWYGANRPEFREALAYLPVRFFPALPDGSSHAVDFYCGQVDAPLGAVPSIAVRAERGDFIAIHPYSGSARKNWPADRFVELARQAALPVEYCVGEEQTWPGARHTSNLLDLAQWLASARLYVGNDSGITHLAAAVGTPVIALFGPTDPAVWAPRGDAGVGVIHRAAMDHIAVEEVLELVRRETGG